MRWTASHFALLVALGGLTVGTSCAAPPQEQEAQVMKKSGSRIPAPAVAPVSSAGVRYEQVRNGLLAGFDQMGGYLVAIDEASGQRLWALKVYDNLRVPGKEGDVQDVFFKSLTLQPDGRLQVENERGRRFVVDPQARTSTALP